MKLLRHGNPGSEKPGLLDTEGRIRDLSAHLADLDAAALVPASLDALRRLDPSTLPEVPATTRLGPPIDRVGKFVAIGLNYHDHARESGMPIPEEPVLFPKWSSCLSGPTDPIVPPPDFCKLDWEVELAMVIGSRARNVGEADALQYLAGYCVANDVSERHYQLARSGGQWGKGKGFDTFGPLGPWLVTADEVPDPQDLHLWLKVNGEPMQDGSTREMIFSCAFLVSYCSRLMTLEPGDVIITGTPPGVGMGMKPPRFLQIGDVVELGIDGLGQQRQEVRAAG